MASPPSIDRPAVDARLPTALPALARLPTGAKLFLILSAALLPLALIAVFATLQTTRLADAQAGARLSVAGQESARAIAIELAGDMNALRVAVDALGSDAADAPSCARARGVFAQQSSIGTRFAIVDRAGRTVCGGPLPADVALPIPADATTPTAAIVPDRGVVLAIRGARGALIARAFFPRALLQTLGHPTSRVTAFSSTLVLDEGQLALESLPDAAPLDRLETRTTAIGIGGLALRASVRSAPITSSLVVAMLLPLLMWAAAAGIAWFVVDRLLIRPLRRLRSSVAAFTPGDIIDPGANAPIAAQEIRELGETFRAISRTVALHEQGLAEGLVRQTKLTREVHHRVKNNLQVISSLINFHARGARSPDATGAYASIQRRVDALAVVHRNHFAEMEENRGLNIRTMIGELAANIRANASDGRVHLGITLDVDPLGTNQDVAVAVAFLVTESIELAMSCDPAAQVRVSVKPSAQPGRATLRVVSRALIDSDHFRDLATTRYSRIMEGLSRQLRSPLHHDPLAGAYEIDFVVMGQV